MSTANIRARLGLDSMPYKAGARDVKRQNESMKRSIQQIGAAIGISFGIAGIMRGARALTDYATQASIAARNTGLLTHEFMALNRVGLQANVEARQMEMMLSRVQAELFQAARGSAESTRKFEQMGLSIDDLVKMKPADMLQAVAKAAFNTGIPIGNLADLFGQRLGPQAVTALREIAENGLPSVDAAIGIQADQLERLGSKWTETLDKAKAFGVGAIFWVKHVGDSVGRYLFGVLDNLQTRFKVIELFARGQWDEAGRMSAGMKGIDEAGRKAQWEGILEEEKELQDRIKKRHQDQVDAVKDLTELHGQSQDEVGTAAETRIKTTEEREREANERMIRQRLEGEQKIWADYIAQYDEAIKGYVAAESDALKTIYSDRTRLLNQYYEEDLSAHKAAENKKAQAEKDRFEKEIASMRDRMERERESATGAGITADQLARVGGFMGGERAGMAQVDKQMRIAEISERHLADIAQRIADMADTARRHEGGGI